VIPDAWVRSMEFLIIWLLFGVVSAVVATNKGRSGFGWFVLGVLLGPIGFILSLVVSKNQPAMEQEAVKSGSIKKCPYCAELIKAEAVKCRFCGSDLSNASPTEPATRLFTPQLFTYTCDKCHSLNIRSDVAACPKCGAENPHRARS
jgi:RNA polymerase subunit RPABC4/transcription elongation factor Spt4